MFRNLLALGALAGALSIAAAPAVQAADWSGKPWWPVKVTDKKAGKEIEYTPLEKAEKKWHICILFPHMKDLYWKAVNFGVMDEARRLGVKASLFEAGGYENLPKQLSQFDDCVALGVDAIVLGVISEAGFTAKLNEANDKGIPVVGTINSIAQAPVAGYVDSEYYNQGKISGEHLVAAVKDRAGPVKVVSFPGPQAADWANAGAKGFQDSVANTNIELLETKFGDTGKSVQLKLIEDALQTYDQIDAMWVVSTAAEVAPDAVQDAGRQGVLLMGWTATEGTIGHVKSGRMIGETTEMPVIMGRISMDIAIRVLEKKEHAVHIQPAIKVLTKENLDSFDMGLSFAPETWEPVYTVD